MKINVHIEVVSPEELSKVAAAIQSLGTTVSSQVADVPVINTAASVMEEKPVKAAKPAKAPKAAKPVVEAPVEVIPPTPSSIEAPELYEPVASQFTQQPAQAPAFDRAATIAKIQETAQMLASKVPEVEAQRAFITDCFTLAQIQPSSMSMLPDEQMKIVFPIFYNKVMGLVNGNVTGALV